MLHKLVQNVHKEFLLLFLQNVIHSIYSLVINYANKLVIGSFSYFPYFS